MALHRRQGPGFSRLGRRQNTIGDSLAPAPQAGVTKPPATPAYYAKPVKHIVENEMLNGEVIRQAPG